MINDDELVAAHNALVDTDDRYGKRSAYVNMGPYYTKLIKAKHFLGASGTVAERDAIAYNSKEFTTYVDNLRDATIDLEILEAKRESWQREIEIWRTLSANRRR